MRVLVTGGAGFIGSHLVRACLEAGERVRVFDDLSSGTAANLEAVASDIEFVEGTVVDFDAVERAALDCDVVYHQAAIASVPRSVEDPIGTHAVNTVGTLHVLEAARRAGVRRTVFASSTAVYGSDETLPKRETMPARPLSPYALQKLTGEMYCARYTDLYGADAVALRYFNVYGPRQDPTSMYAGVIPIFVSLLVAGKDTVIFGDGEQTRDFVYVSDVVRANRAAASAPAAAGRVFNVGAGTQISVRRLLDEVARALDLEAPTPSFAPERAGDVRHSLADTRLARDVLGWAATTAFPDGLRETVAYYREAAA